MLAASCPDVDSSDLARLSIGRRDGLLLELRAAQFGSAVVALTDCPECGTITELTFEVSDIRLPSAEDAVVAAASLVVDGRDVAFRLPNSLDLIEVAAHCDPDAALRALLVRCHVPEGGAGASATLPELSPRALQELDEQLGRCDPQADVRLSLTCPACDVSWSAPFDISAFLWSEVTTSAHHLATEVHALAAAYGWREVDILAMSTVRRRLYLGLIA